MRVEGYKLNGYNATYEKTCFEVRGGYDGTKGRVLEVTDINSGMTFIFETNDEIYSRKPNKTRVWRDRKTDKK